MICACGQPCRPRAGPHGRHPIRCADCQRARETAAIRDWQGRNRAVMYEYAAKWRAKMREARA